MSDSDFFRFAGQLFFEPENNSWNTLPSQVQEEFCLLAQKNGFGLLFFHVLKNSLPEKFFQLFRKMYLKELVKTQFEEKNLNDLYQRFEAEKIPYIPIKGADWAFRIYPEPALRPHTDWDIMFRKKDCPRVLELIQELGYHTFSGFRPKMTSHHHCERMHNGMQVIEIHWLLPHFGSAKADDMWRETEAEDEYHHILTPEMNLLLISAHALNSESPHVPIQKILMDAGFILKHDKINWQKVHDLADRWGILRPDILFGAWGEFFPAGMLPAESLLPETRQLIRETFNMTKVLNKYSKYSQILANHSHFSLSWLFSRFRYEPAEICLKYHLPANQSGRIFLYWLGDLFGKAAFFLTHFNSKNPELQHFFRNMAQIKDLSKHKK